MKTLKFILASLFSNKRIVDEGSQHPFWVAIIIFLIYNPLSYPFCSVHSPC